MSVCTPRCEIFCCSETLLMPNVTGEPSCNLVPSSCSRCQCHVPGAELKHFCCVASHNAPPLRHSSWHLTWFSQVNVFTGVNFRSRFFPMFATPSSARVLIQSFVFTAYLQTQECFTKFVAVVARQISPVACLCARHRRMCPIPCILHWPAAFPHQYSQNRILNSGQPHTMSFRRF